MADETPKPTTEDILEFIESASEMDAFARRIGERPIEVATADGKLELLLRPITTGASMAVDRAIPGVAADDPSRAAKLAARSMALAAGEVAVCLNLRLDDERTFDRPGRGERRVTLPVYIRDAARHVLRNFTSEEMGRILEEARAAADPIALENDAGKGSAPSSATSKRRPGSGASPDPEGSPSTSPGTAAAGTSS